MRKLFTLVVALGAITTSFAQLYTQGKSLAESVAFRLVQPHIQTELVMTVRQKDAVSKILADCQRRIQAANGGAQVEKLERAAAKDVLMVLNGVQMARVRQLAIQDTGAFALRDASVAREVGLTPAQKSSIEAIAKRTINSLDALGTKVASQIDKLPKNAPEKKRQQIGQTYIKESERIESMAAEEVLALLSKTQKTKWTALQGKPFKL
jgi:hypothetical protein